MFLFSVKRKKDPNVGYVLVLLFRLVWRFQKTKPEVEKIVACENIEPEILFCPKITFECFTLRIRLLKILPP